MIISSALREVFKGEAMLVNGENREIQFHYGDQKELNLWLATRGSLAKFPLIWYVIKPFTKDSNNVHTVDSARIVLMQLTRKTELNTWRSENTYIDVIDPLSDIVINKLKRNVNTNIIGDVELNDEPRYGLPRHNDETTSSNKSIATEHVDARILRFDLEIKPYCIIK